MEENKSLAVFQDKKIRRTWHDNEWWFAIEDIVQALTDSNDPKQYIQKINQRDEPLSQGRYKLYLPFQYCLKLYDHIIIIIMLFLNYFVVVRRLGLNCSAILSNAKSTNTFSLPLSDSSSAL